MMGMVSQQDFAALAARVDALERVVKSIVDSTARASHELHDLTRTLQAYGTAHPALPVFPDPLVWCVSHDPTIMDQK